MKSILFLIATLSTFICVAQTEDNLVLKKMYADYELDHAARRVDWRMRDRRDSVRQVRVMKVLNSIKSPTSNDYVHAATVFSSGKDSISEVKLVELMTKAVELDPTRDKSLLAQGIDCKLVRVNKPQLFGTQAYLSMYEETYGQVVMYEVDTIQVSDSQRVEYSVRTLAEQRAYLKSSTEKPLNDMMVAGKSFEEVVEFCKNEFKENPKSKYVSEGRLSKFGNQLKRAGELEQAATVLVLITELYPNSFNAFDVLGDYYFKIKEYQKGIAAYERSLELNPFKDYARKKIAEQKNR